MCGPLDATASHLPMPPHAPNTAIALWHLLVPCACLCHVPACAMCPTCGVPDAPLTAPPSPPPRPSLAPSCAPSQQPLHATTQWVHQGHSDVVSTGHYHGHCRPQNPAITLGVCHPKRQPHNALVKFFMNFQSHNRSIAGTAGTFFV